MNKKDFFAAATGWDLAALDAALATRPDLAAAQDRRGRTGLDPVIHGSGQAGWNPEEPDGPPGPRIFTPLPLHAPGGIFPPIHLPFSVPR